MTCCRHSMSMAQGSVLHRPLGPDKMPPDSDSESDRVIDNGFLERYLAARKARLKAKGRRKGRRRGKKQQPPDSQVLRMIERLWRPQPQEEEQPEPQDEDFNLEEIPYLSTLFYGVIACCVLSFYFIYFYYQLVTLPAGELSKSVLRGRCALQTQNEVCPGPWISLEVPGNRCFEKPAHKGPENWPRIRHRGRAGRPGCSPVCACAGAGRGLSSGEALPTVGAASCSSPVGPLVLEEVGRWPKLFSHVGHLKGSSARPGGRPLGPHRSSRSRGPSAAAALLQVRLQRRTAQPRPSGPELLLWDFVCTPASGNAPLRFP
ncbi:uncharacterized protein RHO17_019964 isoform 1-T2 [Thomomys bottae]